MLSAEERLRNSPAEKPRVYPAAGREDWGGFPSSGPVGSTRPLRRSSALSTSHERMAEQALLGCVLVDDFEVWGELDQHPIEAEDFLFPEHKALWRAFRWLYSEGLEVTMPSTICALSQMQTLSTVDQWLDRAGYAGVEEYLTELLSFSFSAKGCSAFLRAVKHYSDMRAPASPSSRWEIGL